jgi:hypothetical protein
MRELKNFAQMWKMFKQEEVHIWFLLVQVSLETWDGLVVIYLISRLFKENKKKDKNNYYHVFDRTFSY